MKLYVLHATDPAADPEEIDSRHWPPVAEKAEPPTDREPIFDDDGKTVIDFRGTPVTIDETRGWAFALVCQGMVFHGDHIAVRHLDKAVEIISWNNDPGDYDEDDYSAEVWRFYPIKKNGSGGGQTKTWYLSSQRQAELEEAGILPQYTTGADGRLEEVTVHPYSEFVPPETALVRHGIWVLDDLFRSLSSIALPGIEEWIGEPL